MVAAPAYVTLRPAGCCGPLVTLPRSARGRQGASLRLFFADADGTSSRLTKQLLRWTLDGMAETPDGRTVEPDDRDSWLVLLDLV